MSEPTPDRPSPPESSRDDAKPPTAAPRANVQARPDRSLDELLQHEPYRFEFFQAVRLMHRLFPQRRGVGHEAAPGDEVVRFRTLPRLEFPPSQLVEIRESLSPDGPQEMTIAIFGMMGLNGGLPHHYTEWINARGRRDTTLRDFLDLFNHRLISLFYRAWEKYHFQIPAEQALLQLREESNSQKRRALVRDERPRRDHLSQALLDLAGLGSFGLRYDVLQRRELKLRTSLADDALRFFSGLLAQRHPSAAALESLLTGYFRMPIRIQQLSGQWLMLDDADLTRFSEPATCQLGISAVAGKRVWDVQSKFRVSMGPLTFEQYCDLLPIGSAYRPTADWARLFSGMELDFDLELVLTAEEVPSTVLERPGNGIGPRLGWTTWLSTRSRTSDERVVLRVDRT